MQPDGLHGRVLDIVAVYLSACVTIVASLPHTSSTSFSFPLSLKHRLRARLYPSIEGPPPELDELPPVSVFMLLS